MSLTGDSKSGMREFNQNKETSFNRFASSGVFVDDGSMANQPYREHALYWADRVILALDESQYGADFSAVLNMHGLISLLQQTLRETDYSNIGYREYFEKTLKTISRREVMIIERCHFKDDLVEMERIITKRKTGQLVHLTNEAKRLCDNGAYLDAALCASAACIEDSGSNAAALTDLAKATAYELLTLGLTPSSAQIVVLESFDILRVQAGKISTRFQFEHESNDVAADLKALTLADRLKSIGRAASSVPKKYHVVFLLNGANLDKPGFFGGAYFYKPNLLSFARPELTKTSDYANDDAGFNEASLEPNFKADLHVVIPSAGTRQELAVWAAQERLNVLLDNMAYSLGLYPSPLEVQPLTIVLDSERVVIGSEWIRDGFQQFGGKARLQPIINTNGSLSYAEHNVAHNLIARCLRWMRKASAATNLDDRFIGYWTVLEKISASARDSNLGLDPVWWTPR
jgi:hypothetical protein